MRLASWSRARNAGWNTHNPCPCTFLRSAMNLIKGFMAVSLFSVVPVKLYELCVSLQANFGYAISGAGASFGTVAGNIIDELTVENFVDFATTHVGGFGSVTSPIMVLFCIILMAYAVIKVFFANLKRGGILLIQIAVGSLYMFSVPRGYLDGYHAYTLSLSTL